MRIGKRIAIIQSNYIPWKGYFDIINSVDEFVIYDQCQYTKNDWRNRNKIKTVDGVQWLTIPVGHHLHQTIEETEVSDPGWARRHWKSIVTNYRRAQYFPAYEDLFRALYGEMADERRLSWINDRFLRTVCRVLGIRTVFTCRAITRPGEARPSGSWESAGRPGRRSTCLGRPPQTISPATCSKRQGSGCPLRTIQAIPNTGNCSGRSGTMSAF